MEGLRGVIAELMYSWGEGGFGALGHGDSLQSTSVPTRVYPTTQQQEPLPTLAVAAGTNHSFAVVDVNGSPGVMAWGASAHGRLGIGDTTIGRNAVRGLGLGSFPAPTRCFSFDGFQVTQLACGSVHTLAITFGGVAWVWGDGGGGRLGNGDTKQVHTPMIIPAFKGKRTLHVRCYRCRVPLCDPPVAA